MRATQPCHGSPRDVFDQASRQFVLERPIEGAGIRTAWSPDGCRFYRLDGGWLAAYDATGAEQWRTDLGIASLSLQPSRSAIGSS